MKKVRLRLRDANRIRFLRHMTTWEEPELQRQMCKFQQLEQVPPAAPDADSHT